jgi:hypothetical protein
MKGRGLRLQGFELRVMGVVAVGAKIINPFPRTGEVSHPFSMNACPPILILIAVAFTAESITLCKFDKYPVK